MDRGNWWKFWCANRTNNSVDKYAVCIRKSGKVERHLKKGATGRFVKTIIFPGMWCLFKGKKNNIWEHMQSWLWWRFVGHLQTKACWSRKVYRLIARWTYQTKKIKLRNYNAKKIFFFTFCNVQCFELLILSYLWFAEEKIWFVKSRVHYMERSLYREDL